MRSDKIAQIAEIYTGGRHADQTAAHIEAALTRRDEFGRVMTPKEAFRDLCYKYALPSLLRSVMQAVDVSPHAQALRRGPLL